MKARQIAAAATLATGVSAQAPPAYTGPVISPVPTTSSAAVSYTTVTYDDCPSQSIETLITVTNGVTVTYCPECQASISATKPAPSHTTVYTTVYQSLCSTGLVPVTYTVTEECAEPTPTWATGTAKNDHVPQGFTVTVKDCHVCDKTPVPVTITEPCKDGCGKPSTPPPTGAPAPPPSGDNVKQIPDGQVQAPAPSGGSGGSNGSNPPAGGSGNPGSGGSGSPAPSGGAGSPAPSGGASNPGSGNPAGGAQRPPASGDSSKCSGPECPSGGDSASPPGGNPAPGASASNGGAAPYPTSGSGDNAGSKCPGPECAHPSGGAGSSGNSSDVTPEPYAGGANTLFVSSLVTAAAVVAALAFAL